MQNFWEMFGKFSKITSEHFKNNFKKFRIKFCKVFRKFARRNVHNAGSCKVPFLQAKGCFLRSHTWFVHIQFLITISSPFTPWSKHSLCTFPISCEFCVLLMLRKNKPRNPLTFRTNADPGAKSCEKRGANCEKKGREIPSYTLLFFAFHDHSRVFHDTCIAGLTSRSTRYKLFSFTIGG